MLDYKDVAFSFQDRRARGRRRLLKLFLLLALVVAAFLGYRWWKAKAAVDEVQALLLADRLDEAGQRLRDAISPLFQRGNFRELQALEDLFRGRLGAAAARFDELRRTGASTSLRSGRLLAHLFDRGETAKLKLYCDYLLPRGSDEAFWFHALSRAASMDPDGAENAVAGLSPSFREANAKARGILAGFIRLLRAGRVDYVFDCNDAPLAYYDTRRRATRSLVPGIEFAAFHAQFREGARRFRLTLDGGLQKKVDRLFRAYFGTLVLLGLPENGIVVAYSKPRAGRPDDAAFSEAYDPGSVVKIISLLAYLRNGAGVFPLVCLGHFAAGSKVIYELEKHGPVRDFSQALARSCNVAFALMGRSVGFPSLAALLRRFFFNGPPFRDQFCSFAAGRFADREGDDRLLAELAAGLDGVSMTTLHAAVLAAAFAQNGRHFPPYLIDDTKNILGLGFYRHEARPAQLLADDLNFLRVKKAMAATVEDEKGTGHRLRGATPRMAIKTGTTGNVVGGLDAVIVGFFPVEKPRYAFAFRLEGGGRADVVGAQFLNDLLRVLYPGAE